MQYQEDVTVRKVRVGAFGNQSPTELHHQLYAQVFDKHMVTELVSSAD